MHNVANKEMVKLKANKGWRDPKKWFEINED